MKDTVTILNVLAFALVVIGLGLVFRQNNSDAKWAVRSASVASGEPPPGYPATGKWMTMEPGEQALAELGAQADYLYNGIPQRQKGATIALIGASLVLTAAVLPLWWT